MQKSRARPPESPRTRNTSALIGRDSFNRSSSSSGHRNSGSVSEDLRGSFNSSTRNRNDRTAHRLFSKEHSLLSKISSRYLPFSKSRSRDDSLQLSELPSTDNIPLEQFVSPESGPLTTFASPNNRLSSNSRPNSILTFMYSNSLAPVRTAESGRFSINTGNIGDAGVGGTSESGGTGVGWPGYGGVTHRPNKQKAPFIDLHEKLSKLGFTVVLLCFFFSVLLQWLLQLLLI